MAKRRRMRVLMHKSTPMPTALPRLPRKRSYRVGGHPRQMPSALSSPHSHPSSVIPSWLLPSPQNLSPPRPRRLPLNLLPTTSPWLASPLYHAARLSRPRRRAWPPPRSSRRLEAVPELGPAGLAVLFIRGGVRRWSATAAAGGAC